jgi:5,10-methylenetetrahydromethanopterin reductase
MRIGVLHGDVASIAVSLSQIFDMAKRTEAAGLDTFWMPAIFGHDPLIALAVIGREVPRVELGSNIVHAYPVHPLALAEQAMTAQVAVGGRLVLGIGISHQAVIENRWGGTYRPVGFVREYLDALDPLVRGEAVQTSGQQVRCSGQLRHPDLIPIPLLLAALGPQMLRLAGQRTTGTTTWMSGPQTVRHQIAPAITEAAREAGRPTPRIVASVPILVTDDLEAGRAHAQLCFGGYARGPAYMRMLAHEGWEHPGEAAIVGAEEAAHAELDRYAAAGATDFAAAVFSPTDEGRDRTLALLSRYRAANHGSR